MELQQIKKGTSPLCFLDTGELVCYKQGNLLLYNQEIVLEKTIPILKNWKERILNKNRYLSRLLRLGIRTSMTLDSHTVILSHGNSIYEFDFESERLSRGFYCGDKIRPLTFAKVENISGVDDGVYFGGYLGNMNKSPVNIYHREGEDDWRIVYTFPQDTINHVHRIVADPFHNCLWVFTGDFGDAAAIWKVTDNFRNVERVYYGDQIYRACVVYAMPEGLLYATDSPLQENHIFLLRPNGNVEKICPINGSCIYGCQWKNNFVFQTTVEPTGIYKNRLHFFFCWVRGSGIKDNYMHLYVGNLTDGFRDCYQEKKDWLPFVFQFGTIRFPSGKNDSENLFIQPVAAKRNDLKLMILKK